MAMGDLARLPRPDEQADTNYDVPLDPWQRAVVAAQALEQTAPPQQSGPPPQMGSLYGMAGAGEIAQTVGKKYGDAVAYYAGMPAMAVSPPPNPYPEGSEEAQFWDNSLQDAKRNWAIQTGAGMVFDPLGVKRSVGAGGVTLGSGAGSRIIQPQRPGSGHPDLPIPKGKLPIDKYRAEAPYYEANLPPVEEGYVRLWRGNRPGEVGANPSFTNDLAGIALPFRRSYGGDLSYVDVLAADLPKHEMTAGVAKGAEFALPKEIAAQAKVARPSPPRPAMGSLSDMSYREQ